MNATKSSPRVMARHLPECRHARVLDGPCGSRGWPDLARSIVERPRARDCVLFRADVLRDGGISPLLLAPHLQDLSRLSGVSRIRGPDLAATRRVVVGRQAPRAPPEVRSRRRCALAGDRWLLVGARRVEYVPSLERRDLRRHRGPCAVSRAARARSVQAPVSYTHLRAHETPEHLV